MTIKPRCRKRPSKEHWGYDLTVTLSLPAHDMRSLLRAAQIGFRDIADGCIKEGLPHQEAEWRANQREAYSAANALEVQITAAEQNRSDEP